MKTLSKVSLGLLLGSLMALPTIVTAQDTSSQPSSSAPATSNSTTTTPAPSSGSDTTDSSATAPKHGGHKGGRDMGKRMVNYLKEKLNLTDDEVPKVQAIVEDQGKQMATINNDSTLSDDDKKSKIEALRKSTREQIRAILTPEQQTTFDSLKMDRGGKKPANN